MNRYFALVLLALAGCADNPEPANPKKEDKSQVFVIEDSRTGDLYDLALKKDGTHKVVMTSSPRAGRVVAGEAYYSGLWRFDAKGKLHVEGKCFTHDGKPVMDGSEQRGYHYVFDHLPAKREKVEEETKGRQLLTAK